MFNVTHSNSRVTPQVRIQVWMSETLKPYYALQACLSLCQIHDILLPFFLLVNVAKCVIFLFYFLNVMGILAVFISFFVFFIFYFIYKISCILPK